MSVRPASEKVTKLIQLPNGDLWRGMPEGFDQVRPDTLDASAPASPEDAVLEMFQKTKGESVPCQWCGMAFTRNQFNELKEHVETLHKSVLKPLTPEERQHVFDMSNAEIVARVEIDDTLTA